MSCSIRRLRRRRRRPNRIQSSIAAAARPTRTKTPATAPVFLKNDEPPLPGPSEPKVGLSLISVEVTGTPLLVNVVTEVIVIGALVVVCPRLSVVVTKTVLRKVGNVELGCGAVVEAGLASAIGEDDEAGVEETGGCEGSCELDCGALVEGLGPTDGVLPAEDESATEDETGAEDDAGAEDEGGAAEG